jgi:molecular chaperone DnaK
LKTALAGDDIEAVKAAFEKLAESQQKLGEAIYAAQPAEGEEAAAEASAEDVVDAEVVDEDETDKDAK